MAVILTQNALLRGTHGGAHRHVNGGTSPAITIVEGKQTKTARTIVRAVFVLMAGRVALRYARCPAMTGF
jgi:hypothetical protein